MKPREMVERRKILGSSIFCGLIVSDVRLDLAFQDSGGFEVNWTNMTKWFFLAGCEQLCSRSFPASRFEEFLLIPQR